jgi:hypothetical protein
MLLGLFYHPSPRTGTPAVRTLRDYIFDAL